MWVKAPFEVIFVQNKQQLVTIKGTKEGLVFELNDEQTFTAVYDELVRKLATHQYGNDQEQAVSVVVKLGYRYLKEEQKERLIQLIEKDGRFKIERLDMEVISKTEALRFLEESTVKLEQGIVRSGQVLEVTGDLLLIGDVNPGGFVSATGNIFILGSLQGIAHAGRDGDDNAVIIASYMNPMQLRIGKYFSRSPDFASDGVYMEFGYYHKEKEQIIIDKLQALSSIREELKNVERRMASE